MVKRRKHLTGQRYYTIHVVVGSGQISHLSVCALLVVAVDSLSTVNLTSLCPQPSSLTTIISTCLFLDSHVVTLSNSEFAILLVIELGRLMMEEGHSSSLLAKSSIKRM